MDWLVAWGWWLLALGGKIILETIPAAAGSVLTWRLTRRDGGAS